VQTAIWQTGAPANRAAPTAAALLMALAVLAGACIALLPRTARDGRAWGRR
jgi:hypothetical protein